MNFIYDVVLNFNNVYYEFYEWKDSDRILNFRKIPLFRINNEDYINFKYNEIVVDKDFINKIKNNSYLIDNADKLIAILLSNGNEVMGVRFDNDGNIIGRSSLILEEEEDILDNNIYSSNIDYKVVKYNDKEFIPRYIYDKKEYLIKFFNDNKDVEIYKYLYYDLYEKEEDDYDIIKNRLFKILNNVWNDDFDKLYKSIKIFNRVSKKKNLV